MESKNIERLYREKLKDLEITPSPAVWNDIERSLASSSMSKKSVIWYWLSIGAVAALFLLGLFVYQFEKTGVVSNQLPSNQISNIKIKKPFKNRLIEKESVETISIAPVLYKKEKDTELKRVIASKGVKSVVKNIHKVIKKSHSVKTYTSKKSMLAMIKRIDHESGRKIYSNSLGSKIEEDYSVFNNDTIVILNKIVEEKVLKQLDKKDLGTEVKKIKSEINTIDKSWSVAPVLAQYYSGALLANSSIDSRLDNSIKTGHQTSSLGINLAYQISHKIKIKTGIHQINLRQTNTTGLIANSDFNKISNHIGVKAPVLSSSVVSDSNSESDNLPLVHSVEAAKGVFEQDINYIEIPVEISFNLHSSQYFRLSFFGGVSTLFLTENTLKVSRGGNVLSSVGVRNLNNLNISFNFGTDLEYYFSDKWFLNLSPVLKIHTQTFKKLNNNPYLLGVSTGFNYVF